MKEISPVQDSASHQPDLRDLQIRLTKAILGAPDKNRAVTEALSILHSLTNAHAVFCFSPGPDGKLTITADLSSLDKRSESVVLEQIQVGADRCAKQKRVQIERLQHNTDLTILCVPVSVVGTPEVIAILLTINREPIEPFVVTSQLVASYVAFWNLSHDRLVDHSSSLLATLPVKILSCNGLKDACLMVVNVLTQILHCSRAAIALGKGQHLRLHAVSGSTSFDRRSETAEALTAALNECAMTDDIIVFPSPPDSMHAHFPAHEQLGRVIHDQTILTIPLRTQNKDVIGACLLSWNGSREIPDSEIDIAQSVAEAAGLTLNAIRRAEMDTLSRLTEKGRYLWKFTRTRAITAAAVTALFVLPVFPQYIKCDCTLQPVAKRVVCAPFNSILEKSFVTVGDIIQQGQLLARLKDDDIRIEHAALLAEKFRYEKLIDVYQASGDIAASKLADYERQRTSHRLTLLERHIAHLEIRAPIAGVVLKGDLERAQGAPLQIGQVLYEMAPLDSMLVEIYVPDLDISRVESGMKVDMRFDSIPHLTLSETIRKIHPISITVEHRNVFTAETILKNERQLLRSGMKGRARISAHRHSLVWLLLYRPWTFLTSRLGGY